MDLTGIISISGKPGIFKVIGQGKNNIIVESLLDKKRFPAYARHKISSLEDISIYTYEDDVPLKDVFIAIAKVTELGAAVSHKAKNTELTDFFRKALPEYDEDRVFDNDIKKVIQWYNILHSFNLIKIDEEENTESAQ